MVNNTAKGLTVLMLLPLLFLSSVSFFSTRIVYSAVTHLVISEVKVAGTAADDEFIELYNPTDLEVDISAWSIQRETTTGSFAKKNFVSPAVVPAHGFYLIVGGGYDGSTVASDLTHSSFTLSTTGVTVFLVNDQITLTTGDETTIIDKVAIGSTAFDAEGTPFADVPEANASIERKPGASDPLAGNGNDTDSNSTDFALRALADPQNSTSQHEPAQLSPSDEPTATPTEDITPSVTPPASDLSVVINEIAWGGTVASDADEWIEFYNTTSSAVDLTGWSLTAQDTTPNITLSGTIGANSFFLLERSDDITVNDIIADQLYSGALGNTGESLELKNASAQIIDTVNSDGGAWPAGDSGARKSMERINPNQQGMDANWATNDGVKINGLDSASNPILGTPKTTNSVNGVTPTATPTDEPTPTDQTPTPSDEPTATPTVSPTPTIAPTTTPSPTPAPGGKIIGIFTFPRRTIICTLNFRPVRLGFFKFFLPIVRCS